MFPHSHAPTRPWSRRAAEAAALISGVVLLGFSSGAGPALATPLHAQAGRIFYVDAGSGNDQAAGTAPTAAWKSLAKLSTVTFQPGDTVELHRGQTFTGSSVINGSGSAAAPVTITAYGTGDAPTLANPDGWNMLQVQAPHVTVENLRFADGVVFDNSDGQGITGPKYELSGAIAITEDGTDAVVQNNEFTQVGVGVKTYATNTLVQGNNFHDLKIAFRGTDSGSETSYGAIGVSIDNSGATVTRNRFVNCRSTDSPYGADGGAVEIEGFAHPKNDISIDHNTSIGSQGFTEVTETTTADVRLTYNISDDYQQFLAFDTTTHPDGYLAAHNTILRDRGDDQNLFAIYFYRESGPAAQDSWLTISSNVIDMSSGAVLHDHPWPHDHNVIHGTLGDAPGTGDILGAPQLADPADGDYTPDATSPAVDNAGPALDPRDVLGNPSTVGLGPDCGAVERQDTPHAGADILKDGGFEQASSITSTSTPWYSEGASAYGVDSGTGTAHSGSHDAWISSTQANAWGAVKQSVPVTAHTRYRLTVWVQNSGNIEQGWLGAKAPDGTVLSEIEHGAASAYERLVLTVDSGENTTLIVHAGYYAPSGSAWERVDDVSLQALS
ncbi:hypothetical protein QR77_40750 [Streptomyces sp. 150FB]|uniref:hypothetical protein n=1 Tax=Streptomyces sp. 150FB TaxID=1576605 RepID=UPI0005890870|nr:hypothetical protein [Streptomyces sp. 150FB]KIF78393.1 hypothetical protein QR77_40750 [Streptomyces sp. 150FB]